MKKNHKALAATAALLGVVCLLIAAKGAWQQQRAGSEYEDLLETLEQSSGEDSRMSGNTDSTEGQKTPGAETGDEQDNNASEETAEPTPTPEPVDLLWEADPEPGVYETREDIDFAALQERNPDVYAWIEIPGTKVDYPILQHPEDDAYYLTHTIDHEKKTSGAIYTERLNHKDFDDPHTVIYGHNMKNGTMFRSLHDYEDAEFFEENREIIIYLPDQTRYYTIFGAYTYDNRHLLGSYDAQAEEVFRKYLDEVFAIRDFGAHIDRDMEVSAADRIITLSTCVRSGNSSQRYLVQAVLVSIDH